MYNYFYLFYPNFIVISQYHHHPLDLAFRPSQVSATMKARFSTLDIISILEELQQYVGMRVNQVRQLGSHKHTSYVSHHPF